MDKSSSKDILIIKARGVGYFLCLFLCLMFILSGIISLIFSYIWFNKEMDIVESIFTLVGVIVGVPVFSYELSVIIKKARVKFEDNKIITKGGGKEEWFPPIQKKCEEFISYKLTSKMTILCFEFTLINNKTILFPTTQYTKKQLLQILQEIKNRGGFPNQEIKIGRYYI